MSSGCLWGKSGIVSFALCVWRGQNRYNSGFSVFRQSENHFVRNSVSNPNRVNHQPIFLLTAQPWRENSLRVEAFSRDFGRVSLLARSARSRGSELRGVLVPFVPVSASWFGKEELKTLHRAEWLGGWQQPSAQRLMSAQYVNELVLKLTAREDASPELFAALHATLRCICTGETAAAALRCFEWRLLMLLGVAPDWKTDAAGQRVQPEKQYEVQPENAVREAETAASGGVLVRGDVLQALGQGDVLAKVDWADALCLTRLLLDFRLSVGIGSRRALQQLNALKRKLWQLEILKVA